MIRPTAALALLLLLGSAPAMAQGDNTKAPDWKKTEKGAGELFRGIGQEIGKITGSGKDAKKKGDAKKPEKSD